MIGKAIEWDSFIIWDTKDPRLPSFQMLQTRGLLNKQAVYTSFSDAEMNT